MFELNPIKLLRGGIAASRFLRVLFVATCLGWAILAIALVAKPIDPLIGAMIYGFHLGTWYFSLATRSALYHVLELRRPYGRDRAAANVDFLCIGIVLFCQLLYFAIVFRLLEL